MNAHARATPLSSVQHKKPRTTKTQDEKTFTSNAVFFGKKNTGALQRTKNGVILERATGKKEWNYIE